jgi:hypothetical protein
MAEREFPDYTESIKLHFENLKQLTTLNAGSIVVIGTFLKDIFPRENGTLAVSAGIKLLIALSFISFGVSLVLASYGMFQYARRLWIFEQYGEITRFRRVPLGRLFVRFLALPSFSTGLLCFGAAVLVNLYR